MKFLKYRHKWASGYSRWEYVSIDDCCVSNESVLEEFIEDIVAKNGWSDKYRGLEHEVLDLPPKEWLEKEINRISRRIVSYNAMLLELAEVKKRLQNEERTTSPA